MSKEAELKPCPFCGGAPGLCGIKINSYVMCKDCLCSTNHHYDMKDSIKSWNTRSEEGK